MSDSISTLISEIQQSSDPVRQELVSYLREIQTFSDSIVTTREDTRSKVMITGLKLAEFGLKNCEKLPFPLDLLISVVIEVILFIFDEDDSLAIVKQFKDILDKRFLIKCKATNRKYQTCVRYLQDLPTSQNLDTKEKHMHLTRLASDCPINTGANVLHYLAVEISELSGKNETDNFSKLLKKTTVYCCLSICRELFLLSRYTIEISYGLDSNSVMNVIEGGRRDDANLLRFLYKPKQSMIRNFLNFIDKNVDWPVVTDFLQRRGLEIQTSSFDGKTVKIWSARYHNACLSHHDLGLMSCIRCHYKTKGEEGTNTRFLFRALPDAPNKYEILPQTKPNRYIYFKDWVRYNRDPPTGTGSWRIVEVEADDSEETLFLLLNGDRVDGKCAIYTDVTGIVNLQSPSITNIACFWKLSIEA